MVDGGITGRIKVTRPNATRKKMTDKYKNKYRIPSTRLQNWDYGSNGAYFVTVCTQHREHYFGDIAQGVMKLSEIGKIVSKHHELY